MIVFQNDVYHTYNSRIGSFRLGRRISEKCKQPDILILLREEQFKGKRRREYNNIIRHEHINTTKREEVGILMMIVSTLEYYQRLINGGYDPMIH